MKKDILLSIALVTKNRPESLERCLKSLKEQDEQPDEIIISDDSDDDYQKKVKNIADLYQCQYLKGPKRGLYANRNHVAVVCKGTHIRTMDDDHEFPEGHIRKCMEAIKSDSKAVWFIGEYLPKQKIEIQPPCPGQLHPRGFSCLPNNDQNCWAIADGASIYPREIIDKNIRYIEDFKFGYSYLELGSRLYKMGHCIRFLKSTYIIHHYDVNNRSFYDPIEILSSRFFAMLCHSFKHQRNFKNRLLTLLEIIKTFILHPSRTVRALPRSIRVFKKTSC